MASPAFSAKCEVACAFLDDASAAYLRETASRLSREFQTEATPWHVLSPYGFVSQLAGMSKKSPGRRPGDTERLWQISESLPTGIDVCQNPGEWQLGRV